MCHQGICGASANPGIRNGSSPPPPAPAASSSAGEQAHNPRGSCQSPLPTGERGSRPLGAPTKSVHEGRSGVCEMDPLREGEGSKGWTARAISCSRKPGESAAERQPAARSSWTKRSATVQQPPSSSSAVPQQTVLLRRRACQHRSEGGTKRRSGQEERRAWQGPCCHKAVAWTCEHHC